MLVTVVRSHGAQHTNVGHSSCHSLPRGLHNCPDSCLCCPIKVRMDMTDSAFKAHGREMQKLLEIMTYIIVLCCVYLCVIRVNMYVHMHKPVCVQSMLCVLYHPLPNFLATHVHAYA